MLADGYLYVEVIRHMVLYYDKQKFGEARFKALFYLIYFKRTFHIFNSIRLIDFESNTARNTS